MPDNTDSQKPIDSKIVSKTSRSIDFAWVKSLNRRLVFIIVVVLLIGGFLFIKGSLSPLPVKRLTNGGYTYNFKFYDTASLVKLSDGSSAYKYGAAAVAGIKPETTTLFTDCSEIGSNWKQVFTVRVEGTVRPVCTPDNTGYVLYFEALNGRHLFTVTYHDPQTASVYPTLRAIFGSATVSK